MHETQFPLIIYKLIDCITNLRHYINQHSKTDAEIYRFLLAYKCLLEYVPLTDTEYYE